MLFHMVEKGTGRLDGRRLHRMFSGRLKERREVPRADVPRFLSTQELQLNIGKQLSGFVNSADERYRGDVRGALTDFVEQDVSGVRVNGTNVISVNYDARETEIDPFLSRLIASPQTQAVFVEYFDPDFRGN